MVFINILLKTRKCVLTRPQILQNNCENELKIVALEIMLCNDLEALAHENEVKFGLQSRIIVFLCRSQVAARKKNEDSKPLLNQ